ncbi:hypothetical protein [Sphingomonas sp. PP-CC-3G-468]|uniref:hypothetical protein n=1 Tax=Sphingomonas sp. PP-CC-3G-468 TaxID=2135656 RepID=UPI00104F4198|nr:hypothetical protein [Sphingomonas sp. PP-CC-3G-468]
MNSFILSYSPFQTTPTEGMLLTIVRINRHVSQFYQPFLGTYILKSEDTANVVNESFRGVFEQTPYMITLITNQWATGSLPQEVWNWLNHGVMPTITTPPPLGGMNMTGTRSALDALRDYGSRG